jgi:phosphomethylpyrimidine synthase
MGIGIALSCKVNANIGNSAGDQPRRGGAREAPSALKYGADTVMDLSTGGNIDGIRAEIIEASPVPIGTVPIYQAIQDREVHLEDDRRRPARDDRAPGEAGGRLHDPARGRAARDCSRLVQHRITGIVSRGGSLMAQWMIENGKENPLYTAGTTCSTSAPATT